MRPLAAIALAFLVACARPPRSPSPDRGDRGGPAAGEPQQSVPAPTPLAPANAALAWLLGAWECEVTQRLDATSPEVHARGRLIVDAYMDAWIGAGFEADAPAVPKGDMYFSYDTAARSWSLLGFRSDGSRYVLSSPGELVGRVDWTGTMTDRGKTSELMATWTHKGDADLDVKMNRRDAGGATLHLSCAKQP